MWIVFFILVLLIPLAAVVLDSRLGQALARRVEGGSGDDARLRALESEVERLAADLERVREQAEFVTRLLEERTEPPPGTTLPPHGSGDA
ncbi:MAG: hypothetical protein P8177_06320 [Gemmatimonadota bacterium]|jgi:hypothetical protein